eukprot:5260331-Amphidinium_carterae.1
MTYSLGFNGRPMFEQGSQRTLFVAVVCMMNDDSGRKTPCTHIVASLCGVLITWFWCRSVEDARLKT